MRTIWKIEIQNSYVSASLPEKAKFLCLQKQGDIPCMWFEVEGTNISTFRNFKIFGTGHELTGDEYLGTFQDGPYVWHVYEIYGN